MLCSLPAPDYGNSACCLTAAALLCRRILPSITSATIACFRTSAERRRRQYLMGRREPATDDLMRLQRRILRGTASRRAERPRWATLFAEPYLSAASFSPRKQASFHSWASIAALHNLRRRTRRLHIRLCPSRYHFRTSAQWSILLAETSRLASASESKTE